MLVQIGRIGRSLGVHLLLASQRLEEGKLRGLDTYLSYRIGLRTFSASESRRAIGVPDAYHLPPVPGSGYLTYDTAEMTRFRAAYVSAPYAPEEASSTEDDDIFADSLLDVLVGRISGQGPPAHQVWLPPLDVPATLDELLPELATTPERGLHPPAYEGLGGLRVPAGLVDRPDQQRRDLMYLDFSGAAGHGLVVGAPQTGKSTLLRTVVCALALTHTPSEVQCYCLDFGGGSMQQLQNLPHVGGVSSRLDPEHVRRTVAEVSGLLTTREEFFRTHGIDSMAAYRRGARPESGRTNSGEMSSWSSTAGRASSTSTSTSSWKKPLPTSGHAASDTASTCCSQPPAMPTSAQRCATTSAPRSSCVSPTRWTRSSHEGWQRMSRSAPRAVV